MLKCKKEICVDKLEEINLKDNKILQTFLKYTAFNILGMIGFSCYILADTVFVARGVGTSGLAALNLAIPLYSIISGLGLMIGIGGATRYAIARGSKDKELQDGIFTQAFFFTIIVSVILVIFGFFLSESIAAAFCNDLKIERMMSDYLKTIFVFTPMFAVNNVVNCFVRNDNNPKLAAAAMMAGSLSNIILDFVFIFPCNMGLFGAALATGIAPVVGLLVLSVHFIQKKNGFFLKKEKLHLQTIMDISKIGASSLIGELSSGIVIAVFNTMVLRLAGTIGVAAYGIIANVALVVISIFNGMAQGMQPIISDNYGKQKFENVKKTYHYGLVMAIITAILIYTITFLFEEPIISIFNKENSEQLAQITRDGMKIYFAAFFFSGINIVSTAYFSAVDKPIQAFTISILRGFVVIVPIIILFALLFQLNGVWISMPTAEIMVFIVTLIILNMERKKLKIKNKLI